MYPNPRRSSDLDFHDLECLIKLCETRIHTINVHLKKTHFTNATHTMKTHAQLESILSKLKKLKSRLTPLCDGA